MQEMGVIGDQGEAFTVGLGSVPDLPFAQWLI